jgi:hypothetical protein
MDADRLYWASPGSDCEHGSIRSVSKAGGAVTTLAVDEPNPRALGVDDARVYFYDSCGTGRIASVAKTGGAVQELPVAMKPEDARVLAVFAGDLYFNGYGLLRMPKDGGPLEVIDESTFVLAVATDKKGIFWAGVQMGTSDDVILALDAGASAPRVVADVNDVRYGLALDAKYVYFNSGDFVKRVPRAGGSVQTLAAANAWKLAVDDTHVYWTEGVFGADCAIKKAPKSGGESIVVATCTGAYVDIAVDERCVYWANLYGSNVVRAPK